MIAIIGILAILATELTGLIYQWTLSEPKGWWQRLFFESDFDSRNKYLLSAAAQVLGAVFALLFSITLVAGQSVAKYTHRTLTVIFNKWILGYMGAFGGAIIWILSCISYPTDARAVMTVMVGIIFVCLSVPLFFWYLVQRMNLEGMSLELKRIGLNATKKNVEKKTVEMISAIANIGTVALNERNFEAFASAQGELANFALELETKVEGLEDRPDVKELHESLFKRLGDTCKEFIDNPRAPGIIIKHLGRIGAKAMQYQPKKLYETEWAARNIIVEIALLCDRDNRIPLSVECVKSLKIMLDSVPPGKTNRTKELMEDIIGIFNIHFEHKWKEHLPKFLHMTFEFLTKYKNQPDTPEFSGRLLDHFFSYFNFWAKHDMLDEASGNYRHVLNLLDFLKEKEYFPRYTKPVLERLGEYAKTALSKNQVWREKVAERIYRKVEGLSNDFVKNGPHELLPVAQKIYFYSLGTNQLKDETSKDLFKTLLNQIAKISNIKGIKDDYWDAEWSTALTKAFEVTGRQFTKKFGINLIQELWYDIKTTGEWIIKQAFKRGNDWVELLLELHQFFFQSMVLARSSDTLPVPFQEEIFKWTWITFVTFRREGAGWDDLGNYLLQNKGFAKDFFDQYYRAAKEEGMKLGISGDTFEERRGFLAAISQYNLPQSS